MKAHPAADLFPLMAEAELAELTEDIRKHGLHEPVWLVDHEGESVILDGRNRHRACELAGVQPKTRRYDGTDPIGFSLSQNVHRRHLTAGQKAAVAFDVLPLYEEEGRKAKAAAAAEENRRRAREAVVEKAKVAPTLESVIPDVADLPHPGELGVPTLGEPEVQGVADRPDLGEPKEQPAPRPGVPKMKAEPKRAPLARDRAAAAVGASGRGVAQYARLVKDAPDLAEKVKSGEVALDAAEKQLIRDKKRAEQRERTTALAAKELPKIDRKYSVIYADPPWRYDFAETENRAIENHYPTMTVEDIAKMEIPATDDAVLFMWATNPKLTEAFQVLEGWGFNYVTNMVWVKDRIGMGYYARSRHELLFIAKRGNPPTPEASNRPDSVITAPRTRHSAKPVEAYDLIERMYPGLPKLEMFCRSPRDGWAAWGNEA